MVREVKRNEVEEEIRKQVDNLMRDELDLLKIVSRFHEKFVKIFLHFCLVLQAVERDKGKKGKIAKKKKKKGKASKKGKKKKEKDLTPDRTTEVKYPKYKQSFPGKSSTSTIDLYFTVIV